jgi:hypothetical protein
MESKKLIQSYLYTDYGNFFVSTIHRISSSPLGGWFYETFAYKLDKDNKSTDWVADNSGSTSVTGALDQHGVVCEQLIKKGEFKEEEDEY